MTIRHLVIAAIAAAGFSFAASAAPVAQTPVNSNSAFVLAKVKGGHHMGGHHMHRGHWRHHHRHHRRAGPFCEFSLAPWCWN